MSPGIPLVAGADGLQLLPSGPSTLSRLLALLRGATSSVELEMYELDHPQLLDALLAAQHRGVAVSVIDDPSVDVTANSAAALRAGGIAVHDYPVRTGMIDHVKLLVVDRRIAVVGGINWGRGSFNNRDADIEVTGPAATNLQRVFDMDLITCGVTATVGPPETDSAVTVATTLPGTDIGPLALRLIRNAQQTVELDLFVLTDQAVVSALIAARHRGVAVRVLLDPNQHSGDQQAALLADAGVTVHRYISQGEKLHAKVGVADGGEVLVGSANWTAGGFVRNHELDVAVHDNPGLAAQMQAAMNPAWNQSESN
jgi:phosphatidylserine/phosphatidylglycerophosphate/cardiolipin synthase-like enzyme